ncbi:MAG: PEP-CTERM sorting domain-containing protein [Pseudomonadales bacterium]
MNKMIRLLTALALFGSASIAQAAYIAHLEDTTGGGGFFGTVKFEDVAPGEVLVTADISSPVNLGLRTGDILGLWFEFATFISDDMVVLGDLISFTAANNGVSNTLGGNINLIGAADGGWDLGVRVGTPGAPDGFNQVRQLSFVGTGLTAEDLLGQRVGMRVQSISGIDFDPASSKLLGVTTVPEPGVLGLMLMGLGMIGFGARRRQR